MIQNKSFFFFWNFKHFIRIFLSIILFLIFLRLLPFQGKDKTAEERRIAICIFDDVAEQCHEAALKYAHLS